MSDEKLGYDACYICGSALDPLTSICPTCGYSQLPNTNQDAKPDPLGKRQKDLRADLKSKLNQSKASYRSRLKK